MKAFRLAWLVAVLALLPVGLRARMLAPIATNQVVTAAAAHIVPLFNGRDLTGWTPVFTNAVKLAQVCSVENGVLVLSGKPNGYIRTERTFANYHLHVEWRWPQTNGNSGVFVHVQAPDAIWPKGVECQLRSGSAGELIAQGGSDFAAPLINGKKRAKISNPSERPVGAWNQADIYCRGDTIETQVNGVRQNLVPQVSVTSGAIGLQFEGYRVEFRNLWLEPL